jgi:hypothetical protein
VSGRRAKILHIVDILAVVILATWISLVLALETITHAGLARAQETPEPFRPGRGYLGTTSGAMGLRPEIWEPEPGVRCYTYGSNGISCIPR